MELPYTTTPTDALMAAQVSVGAAFTAIVWHRPLRPLPASLLLLAAAWLAILAPIAPPIVTALGGTVPTPHPVVFLLNAAAAMGTVAMLLARPAWPAAIALVGNVVLVWIGGQVTDADPELAGLHLVWFGALVGLHQRLARDHVRDGEAVTLGRSGWHQDLSVFAVTCALGLVVGHYVLEGTCDSADEWAYNWQALVLARFKAYAAVPPCPDPHRSHWVFYDQGRAFSMYLPGWPMFMAPFARLGVAWAASSVACGLMVAGVARVARRMRGETAGWIAAAAAGLGAATLLNAGSRYCHCFIAATWVWAIEATCAATERGIGKRAQLGWGLVLGVAVGFCAATRPSDAAVLDCGVFLVFCWALLRGRIGWRVLAAGALGLALTGGVTLIVLRLQLGAWFKTGYGYALTYYWWTKLVLDTPARDAWKYGLPFATAAYCFFPAAAALAAIGLVSAGRRIAFMLALGTFAHLWFYVLCAFGRYKDFGYGPRYHLPLVVSLAIGTGVALGPLFVALGRRRWVPAALVREGPATLAAAAMLLGVVRIAPMMYPYAHSILHQRSALRRAIERESLANAVVIVQQGQTAGGPLLDTQNDPFEPDPPVVILGPQDQTCTRELYKGRTFYRAVGVDEVKFEPY